MSINRETVLAALAQNKVTSELLDVPALGGVVELRALTTDNILELTRVFGVNSGDIPLLVFSLHDPETGTRLLKNEDVPLLLNQETGWILELLARVKTLSGMDKVAPKA